MNKWLLINSSLLTSLSNLINPENCCLYIYIYIYMSLSLCIYIKPKGMNLIVGFRTINGVWVGRLLMLLKSHQAHNAWSRCPTVRLDTALGTQWVPQLSCTPYGLWTTNSNTMESTGQYMQPLLHSWAI